MNTLNVLKATWIIPLVKNKISLTMNMHCLQSFCYICETFFKMSLKLYGNMCL